MGLISIPIFDGGLITNMDPEDIPKDACSATANFEIDVRGKLSKRKGRVAIGSAVSTRAFVQAAKWIVAATNYWLTYDTTARLIERYSGTMGSQTALGAALAAGTTDIKILIFGDHARFATGITNKARWYGYLTRQYFFGGWDPNSGGAYEVQDAIPSYPSTWGYPDITTTGNGNNPVGYYYYKFVPIFDGNQEIPLGESFAKHQTTSSGLFLKVGLSLSTDNFNKRITAIKMYRSYDTSDIAPVYSHVKTIPVNSKATHAHKETTSSSSNVGTKLYLPDYAVSASGHNNMWIELGASTGYYYRIASGNNTQRTYTIDALYSSSSTAIITFDGFQTSLWNGSWKIFEDNGSGTGPHASTVNDSAATGGYAGKDIIFENGWDWAKNERNDWVAKASSQERVIYNSFKKAVQVSGDFTTEADGLSIELTNGYYFGSPDAAFDMYVFDGDLIDAGDHPLGALDKIVVNYKYGQYIDGRLYVANVRLDPDGDAEDYDNFIIYSELLQPDILPIVNFIQIKDIQGGAITGLAKIFSDLVVLCERGIYRLSIPSSNPATFSLLEAEENIGCIADNSVCQAMGTVFFAGADHVYALDQNFIPKPITEPIKDVYQGTASLSSTRIIFDPKKQRLLCRFGSDRNNIYVLDLVRYATGQIVWNKMDMQAYPVDVIAIDEDLKTYTVTNT